MPPRSKLGQRKQITETQIGSPLEEALNWALYSFKKRAMTVSSDQLKTECEDIIKGEAKVSWYRSVLIYNGLEE